VVVQGVVAEKACGQGVLEPPGDQGQVGDRWDGHGREPPPRRGGGPQQPPAQDRHQQQGPGQSHPNTDAVQHLHGLRVVDDAEQVVRALPAALTGGVEEQRGQEP